MKRKNKVIAFRVDASEEIGTGHLMRCLTLAEGLSKSGGGVEIVFVSRDLPTPLQELISSRGYFLKVLPNHPRCDPDSDLFHAQWLKVSQRQDALDTLDAIENLNIEWLVVDHYAIDYKWEEDLHARITNLAVIDDLADRHHVCELLIDQNFYVNPLERYTDKLPETCQLLLGPKYALLRNEFLSARLSSERSFTNDCKILICFGGVDYQNHTSAVLNIIASLGGFVEVDVVVGIQCPNINMIQDLCDSYGYRLHIQTKNIARLMMNADISIGSGGTSLWERCAMGLPSIVLATTHNQKDQVSSLAANGIIMAISEIGMGVDGELGVAIRNLVSNKDLRKSFSRNTLRLVDGLGASRIASSMNAMRIKMRLGKFEDAKLVYDWRNHPEVRAHSRDSDPIDYEAHSQWFRKACQSKNQLILIGELDDIPIGVLRFDISENEAEISIFMNPALVSRGFGSGVLRQAEKFLKTNNPSVNVLNAEVLGDNIVSHGLFLNSGYTKKFTKYIKIK